MKSKSSFLHGIRGKLMMYLLLFAAIVLGLLWLLQTILLDPIYRYIKEEENRSVAAFVCGHINDSDLSSQLEGISMTSDTCILVQQADGTIVAHSHMGKNCFLAHTTPSERIAMQSAAADRQTVSALFPKNDRGGEKGGNSIVSVTPCQGTQGTMYIFVSSGVTPVFATQQTIRQLLLWVSIFTGGLVVLFALWISRKFAAPIHAINEKAKYLSKGDYNIDFSQKGYTEVEQLGDTLNAVACDLSKVEGMQKELIANVSHDLRTPLTMITGYAEVIRDIPGENTPENMQIIVDEAQRMSRLINDILDVARFTHDGSPYTPEPVHLTKVVEGICQRVCGLMEPKGFTIDTRLIPDVWVMGDATRLEQVVYNLLGNALTHAGADKRVSVAMQQEEQKVTVSVTDWGDGIAAEDLPFIWNRYYKVDRVHRRDAIGTGLGLSIVQNLVHLHKGSCKVESTPGAGSTFSFTLDILQPPM